MRKLLLVLIVALAVLLVAAWVLPEGYEVRRVLEIGADGPAVHLHVDDLASWPAWVRGPWPDGAAPAPAPGDGDPGLHWATGRLVVTFSDPARGLWYDLVEGDGPPAKGVLLYDDLGETTRVSWIQRGALLGPWDRALGSARRDALGRALQANLEALALRVSAARPGAPAVPGR